MANTSTVSLTEVIPQYYEKRLEKKLKAQLVLYEDAAKRPLPRDMGTTIMFTRYKNFSDPELLSEGTAPTAAALSAENVSTKLYQLGKHTTLTDLIEATSIDPIVESAIDVLSEAGAKAVDKSIGRMLLWRRTSMSSTLGLGAGAGYGLSAAVGCLSASQFQIALMRNGSGNCNILAMSGIHASAVLTVSLLRQARKWLEARNAPKFPDGYYHACAHPDALNVLTATSGWIDMNKYTNLKPLTGEVGTCQHIRFKVSTYMPTVDSAGAKVSAHGGGTVHITYVYGLNAYGVTEISAMKGRLSGAELIVKTVGKESTNDPLNQIKHTIGYKLTHAVKVLNNSCIVGILTGKGDDSLVPA